MVFYELLSSIQSRILGSAERTPGTAPDNLDHFFPDEVRPYLSRFEESARCYKKIEAFLASTGNFRLTAPAPKLYLTAFCQGVQEILDEYMTVLCLVEKTVLEDDDFSPISLDILIEPIAVALSAIADCIEVIRKKELSGCLLIDLCNDYALCGCSNVKQSFNVISNYCMQPFLKQTKSWILRSSLFDPNCEYFFDKLSPSLSETSTLNSTDLTFATSRKSEKSAILPSNYAIDAMRLPKFLPYSVAAKILFIGNTLLMFQNSWTDDSDAAVEILQECGLDESQLAIRLEEIQKGSHFSIYHFDAVITDIYNSVDKFARTVADQFGNLRAQIINMRDIYLLGRGELFQEFLIRANSLLTTDQPSKNALRNLKVHFKNAFYYVYRTENSDLLESTNFTLPRYIKKGVTMLAIIQIEIETRWPLYALFTPTVIENYNKLFSFLIRLKRAQMDILEFCNVKDIDEDAQSLMLRNILLSILVNLQKYCFFDVIVKENHSLMQTVDSTDTFFAVQTALGKFQENVLHQLFICEAEIESPGEDHAPPKSTFNNQVYKCFLNLFSCCQKYSLLAKEGNLGQNHLQIIELRKDVDTTIYNLLKLLRDADSNYTNQYLRNLILSLDYNEFFFNK